MAVDRKLVLENMFPFEVRDLDERVVRDGWTYYVQAVKRPGSLGRRPLSDSGGVGEAVVGVVIGISAASESRRRRPARRRDRQGSDRATGRRPRL